MPDPLEELVSSASHGDQVAVDALLERYLPGLHGFVRLRAGRVLLARESTSDLVQSVCRDVLRQIDRFEYGGEAGFKRWLYATAMRKIADRYEYYRAQKREVGREVPMERPGPGASGSEADLLACYGSFCTPSREIISGEEIERIEKAFETLPEDYREVILLARVVGMERAEIARDLGRTEGAVKTLLSRALARLAEALEPD